MKKILSTILALTLVLSMSVPAYAEVTVDGESKGPGTVSVDSAHSVEANASGDKLTVNGSVIGTEEATNSAVSATNGATIEVSNNVNDSSTNEAIHAIYVESGSTVNVGGNAIENNSGDAINAQNSTVTVEGNVTENGGGNAIFAKGNGTTITVKGDVTENDVGNAVYAQDEALVIVYGSVTENDLGSPINALSGSTVKVGGDVTENGGQNGITVGKSATVIVEGEVEGKVGATGALYLGQLNGTIISEKSNIHYLIGTAAEGSVALNAINLISDIVAAETIDGVTESGYKYTTTADTAALSGKTITLKPATGKILTVSGFSDANVTYVANEDGTVTFTIGDDFKGGLQNLVLVITDKPTPKPTPTPEPKPEPKKTGSSNGDSEKKGASVETTLSTGNYQMTPSGYAPFVAGNTATAGWATITEAVTANAGGTVAVTMNGAVTVDKQVLSTAAASKTSLALGLDNSVNVGLTPDTMSQIMASSSTDAAGNVVDPVLQVSALTYNQAISSPVGTCGFTYEEMASIGAGENAPVVKVVTSNTDASKLLTITFNAAEQGMKPGDVAHLYGGKSGEMGYGYDVIVDENGMATFVVPAVNGFWAIGSVMK